MRKSSRNRSCINSTIENWDSISFNNPILNCIWTLLPGFTLWQIWKERNKRIFHSLSCPPEVTWAKIKSLITETVRSKPWTEADQQGSPGELSILQHWQATTSIQHTQIRHRGLPTSPTIWSPPPEHFIKVNFDGASRGNPGPGGYGAVIRNSEGEILDMEAGYLGDTTNNVAELTGLLRGLQRAIAKGHHKILLEGDSQVIIRLATKILHGSNPDKLSPSWRLHSLLAEFTLHLQPHYSIITSHVKREANKVADHLANMAVDTGEELICWEGHGSPGSEVFARCQALAHKDLHFPDGVTGRLQTTTWRRAGKWRHGTNRLAPKAH
jgi:ribonuclease HI